MSKVTKTLEDNFYLFDKDDEAMKECYEENEMLGDFEQLIKNYMRDDELVVLPSGTELELVEEAPNVQNSPAVWRVIKTGECILVWDWY